MTPNEALDRALLLRDKARAETNVWVRLDVLEGLVELALRSKGGPVASVAEIVNRGKQEGKP